MTFFVISIQNCFFLQALVVLPLIFQTYKTQVKANIVSPTEKDQPPSDGGISSPLYVSHPVVQKKKDVYRTNHTTFIIGETPRGIRRYVCLCLDFRSILKRNTDS